MWCRRPWKLFRPSDDDDDDDDRDDDVDVIDKGIDDGTVGVREGMHEAANVGIKLIRATIRNCGVSCIFAGCLAASRNRNSSSMA